MSERHKRDVARAAKEKGPIEGGVRRVLTPIPAIVAKREKAARAWRAKR